jgi:hypothetical protein
MPPPLLAEKAQKATAIVALLGSSMTSKQREGRLLLLSRLYPAALFSWEQGLVVEVPSALQLPKAVEFHAIRLVKINGDGSRTITKDRSPKPVIGPSVWELIRRPPL